MMNNWNKEILAMCLKMGIVAYIYKSPGGHLYASKNGAKGIVFSDCELAFIIKPKNK